ncbi:hypothetical protein HDU83_003762 [Entophlyctis luteolus]|nr:hypothetical protein HDU83_003762 [Entophlyctis luteolus]KAJ3382503.1 hypothetical protein HDU84_004253 [Entophlyctis sp. JEL0112]
MDPFAVFAEDPFAAFPPAQAPFGVSTTGGSQDLVESLPSGAHSDMLSRASHTPPAQEPGSATPALPAASSSPAAPHRTSPSSSERKLRHECLLCPRRFTAPYKLEEHTRRVHSHERPFECSLCPPQSADNAAAIDGVGGGPRARAFVRLTDLTAHIAAVHADVRAFVCPMADCGKSFKTRLVLKRHLRTHESEKLRPWRCDVCKKGYLQQSDLRSHLLTHTVVSHVPLEDTSLSDAMNILDGLSNVAIETLSAEIGSSKLVSKTSAPWNCLFCGSAFMYRSGLARHIRVKHEGKKRNDGPANEQRRKKKTAPRTVTETLSGFQGGGELLDQEMMRDPSQTMLELFDHDFMPSVSEPVATSAIGSGEGVCNDGAAAAGAGNSSLECGVCRKVFKTLKGLARHRARLHGACE